MSHLPERKEKNCLNCGTHVMGRFCHNCGQENLEPKETVWHLVSHFFQDVTHFDGKFFKSLKDLLLKPGFLSKEYIIGRRASYLNPVRMYLFTSAIFFLIFFSLYSVGENDLAVTTTLWGRSATEIKQMDSVKLDAFTRKMNNGTALSRAEVLARLDSGFTFHVAPGKYSSREQYDSLLRAGVKKHNWFERQLVYKDLELKRKYGSNSRVILPAIINHFLHTLPQMLFVLLPLFALILKLVYFRRKQFYYVDHTIFTIHLYIFVFLVMLVTFGISRLATLLQWAWLRYIVLALVLCIFFYFYKALRNFYRQRRGKTILKYFILLLLFFITTMFMFVVFFFFSLFGL